MDFSLRHHVHTGAVAYPASCAKVTKCVPHPQTSTSFDGETTFYGVNSAKRELWITNGNFHINMSEISL
jgi:hypothetical protein